MFAKCAKITSLSHLIIIHIHRSVQRIDNRITPKFVVYKSTLLLVRNFSEVVPKYSSQSR